MELNILAVETSSAVCSLALLRTRNTNKMEIYTHESIAAQKYTECLLPMANGLLDSLKLSPTELTALAFGQGPGSFTGLRVACGTAQGVAFALGIPAIPVPSTKAVIATLNRRRHDLVFVALDARMDEVYMAVYKNVKGSHLESWKTVKEPFLISALDVTPWMEYSLLVWLPKHLEDAGSITLAGNAWENYPDVISIKPNWQLLNKKHPTAMGVAWVAWHTWKYNKKISTDIVKPIYIRDKVAFTTLERMQGLGGNPRIKLLQRMELHSMTENDVDEVVELSRKTHKLPWSKVNFVEALANGYSACVIRYNSELIAFCVLMFALDTAHLSTIAVLPGLQCKGLGSYLLRWCERQIHRKSIEIITLETQLSNNAAIRFYEKHGFSRVGFRRAYYLVGKNEREDAIIMQKKFLLQR